MLNDSDEQTLFETIEHDMDRSVQKGLWQHHSPAEQATAINQQSIKIASVSFALEI